MVSLPSVWGRHDSAMIDAVLVNQSSLVTSVMNAPNDWGQRLETLGFKRGTKAWLRMGVVTPSEFQFLSPEIDLIGLRPEDVLDFVDEDHTAPLVPFAVQDVALSLWQKSPARLFVALSMEHGVNLKRAEVWTIVEDACNGVLTPETETVIGLSLTKLHMNGSPHESVVDYAQRIGWRPSSGLGTQERQKAKQLFRAGESIQWADSDGVQQIGRVAQRIMSSDIGGWVYKESPKWVGGYPAVAPVYVKRQQIQYQGFAPDWSQAELAIGQAERNDLRLDNLALPKLFTLSLQQAEMVEHIRQTRGCFPPVNGWVDLVSSEWSDADVVEVKKLGRYLDHLSAHYFGDSPLSFAVTNTISTSNLVVRVDNSSTTSFRPVFGVTLPSIVDDGIELEDAAKRCHAKLVDKQKQIERDMQVLGRASGLKGGLLPSQLISSDAMGWERLASSMQGHQLDGDTFVKILAAINPASSDLIGKMPNVDVDVLPRIHERLSARYGAGELMVSTARCVPSGYDLEAFKAAAAAGAWDRVLRASDEFVGSGSVYRITVGRAPEVLLQAGLGNACYHVEGQVGLPHRVLQSSVKEAADDLSVILKNAREFLSDQGMQSVDTALSILAVRPLQDRFIKAITQSQDLPHAVVVNHARAKLMQANAKLFGVFSEADQNRVLDRIASQMKTTATIQGVAVYLGTKKTIFHAMEFNQESLTQSREATLMGLAQEWKNRARLKAKPVVIDFLGLVDPELCQLLAGESKLTAAPDKKRALDDGIYQDTGNVTGLAQKDIRAMKLDDLVKASALMNDQQKAMYLTKDLIWPRPSIEVMKEEGHHLWTAVTIDALWKGLPKSPLSLSNSHLQTYVHLIKSMRDNIEPLMDEVRHAHHGLSSNSFFMLLSSKMWEATDSACNEGNVPNFSKVYPYSKTRITGIGLSWAGFQPNHSSRWLSKLRDLSWEDVTKKRSQSKPGTGSRVSRGDVVRKGIDYREGVDVKTEDFIKTFMFSGVEYGNATSQKERLKHMNLAYDSMMDFANLMGWEPGVLSLGGKLGLCIGSRGKGGSRAALAHFEPANMAMNLTRMRGDGSLAHEYFHALAGHYGRIATGVVEDVTQVLGYNLREPGPVRLISAPNNRLRDECKEAFFNLMVAIMRKPQEDSDPKEIGNYTELSDMLVSSMNAETKSGKLYWSSPEEMFARAMETWVHSTLAEQGAQNDYLVCGVDSEVYPGKEHLRRMNHFISAWMDSLKVDVQKVNHPYLGEVDVPTLYTNLTACEPLGRDDLVSLASQELSRLFGEARPDLLINDNDDMVGMYDAAYNVMTLSTKNADKQSFYHEAWHACHHALLSVEEQRHLNELFASHTDTARQVTEIMRELGWPESIIETANANPEEMAAYAFQLWTTQQHDLGETAKPEFSRTKLFVDGVVEVGQLFLPQDASVLFQRFASGELSLRNQMGAENALNVQGFDYLNWDDDNKLFWSPPTTDPDIPEVSSLKLGM